MTREPLVHVLVINWNGIEHLRECFDSLLACTYQNVRFVLVDNASSDGSVGFVLDSYGADPRVEILECGSNLGWSGGNNMGLRRALELGADYVFLLNNDTVTASNAIERLVKAAESRPEAGALAPKMLLYSNPDLLNSLGLSCSIVGSSWDLGLGRLDGERWSATERVIGACGGAAFFRAEALRRGGLLPEEFEIYYDDLDLCLRIWNAGFEIWTCPEAVVRHKFSATMGQGSRARYKYYLQARNRLRVILRNFPMSRLPLAMGAFKWGEARAIGRSILNGEYWKVSAHVRALLAGAVYLPQAFRVRRKMKKTGAFWPLVRRDMMFFPGVELPVDGWYTAVEAEGTTVKPMSARARLDAEAGSLRVTHVNCYPRCGKTCVEVSQNGVILARLETLRRDETSIKVEHGQVEFLARRIFTAEETGSSIDTGGWIAVDGA